MSVVAGADAGATKTVAVVAEEGREVARITGPGAAVKPDRAMSSAATIARVVRSTLNQVGRLRVDALVVGAAGVGRDEERQALRNALRVEDLADRLQVTTDLEIALEAAFPDGPGVVLLAGTGSVAVARLPDRRIIRQGGYGRLMGDEGSGYALGRAGIQAVGQAHDGRGPTTELVQAMLEATRSPDFDALVRWAATAEPPEVAAIAAPVLAAASAGDAVAVALARGAARELAAHVEALVPRFPDNVPVPVALGGGLLGEPFYRRAVSEVLDRADRVQVRDTPLDPVTGAILLARRLLSA